MSGAESLAVIAAQRKQRANLILAEPQNFKLCECCRSVLFKSNVICPYCHAYRFNFDPNDVILAAQALGDKPLSSGCGVLPRFQNVVALSFA